MTPAPAAAQVLGTPPSASTLPPGGSCANGVTAANLAAWFSDERAGFYGADYQHAFRLANGSVLWMFQDAFVRTASGRLAMQHNVGLLQTGRCFRLLKGADGSPSWLMADRTTALRHWFWPLGGDMGADGNFHLFMAEMQETGATFLSAAAPVATWTVELRLSDLRVVTARRATDSSTDLFGWSVTSDATYSYLYSHCYRQFPTHDLGCAGAVKVARIPKGYFESAPRYWDGARWQADRSRAVPVVPATTPDGAPRTINPTQVMRVGSQYVAITKVGDWRGTQIQLDRAAAPQGPWTTYYTIRPPLRCSVCNTYFAGLVPWANPDGTLIAGLSNNRWDGALSAHYRPTFFAVPAPPTAPAVPPPGPVSPAAPAVFVPAHPCRLLDTRRAGEAPAAGAVAIGVGVVRHCGVPDGATAVAVSLTSFGSTAAGTVTAHPAGSPRPRAAQLAFDAAQMVTNGAVVPLGDDGAIDVFPSTATHVRVDVDGWFVPATDGAATAGRFIATAPARIHDTSRNGAARPAAGSVVRVALPTKLVPAGATAVAITIGTTRATGRGTFTVFAAGTPRPAATHLSTDTTTRVRTAGQFVELGPGGLDVHTSIGDHFTVDVVGWFTGPTAPAASSGLFVADRPVRILDTRANGPAFVGTGIRTVPLGVDAAAALLQTTPLRPAAGLTVSVQPAGAGVPLGVQAQAGSRQLQTTLAATGVSAAQAINITVAGTGHVAVDRVGWFTR